MVAETKYYEAPPPETEEEKAAKEQFRKEREEERQRRKEECVCGFIHCIHAQQLFSALRELLLTYATCSLMAN